MHTLSQDIRYALRQMRKSPGFTLTAMLTLAIGISATTIMFSLVENILLKPLPYANSHQLVVIRESISTPKSGFSDLAVNANHFAFWQRHNRSFSSIEALLPRMMPIGDSQTEEIGVVQMTATLILTLGYQPQLGRTFTAVEEQPGHNVVLLTNKLWRRRFQANSGIIGTTITLDGRQYLVTGVLSPSFQLPEPVAIGGYSGSDKPIEALIPFGWTAEQLQETEGDHNYFSIGRLKPGVSIVQATADMNAMERLISRQTPDKVALTASLMPFQDFLVGSSRRTLLLLLVAVSGILLIACINVANLLLARMAGRAHESAICLAMGATPTQLIRMALMEPLILALTGCIAGMTLASVGLPLLLRAAPASLPRVAGVDMNLSVLAFAVAISILSALGCGFVPARRFARNAPQTALRSETRTSSESMGAKRLGQGLIAGEVMASVMLVLLAGLFVTSLIRLLQVDRGFQTEHILSARVALPDKEYAEVATRNAFYERALERLRELPGVRSSGMVSVLPLDGDNWGDLISRSGDTQPLWQRPGGHFRWISPGYFESLHIPLIAGRFLSAADRGQNVALVSKHTADTVWPGQDPIGQAFRRGDPDEDPIRVIGVVGDIRAIDLAAPDPRMVYVPYWYRSRTAAYFVIRIAGDPASMAPTIRKAIWERDPAVAIPEIRSMKTIVDASVSTRRFQMNLLLGFAICSLLLAAIGIYGMVSYSSLQRTREIGIRMALGAGHGHVYRLVLLEGIAPVLLGTGAGIVLSLLTGHLIANLLFGIHPDNPAIAFLACGILVTVGFAACLLPARRAANVDPMRAIRGE